MVQRKAATTMAGAIVFFSAMFGSAELGPGRISVKLGAAEARVGRPLTPVSVAGVARRTTRRTVVVGAAAAAAGHACVRVLVNGRYVCR